MIGISIITFLLAVLLFFILRQARFIKKMTQSLKHQKQEILSIVSSMGDAVISTNHDNHINFINDVAQRLTGWAGESALGQPLSVVLPLMEYDNPEIKSDPLQKILDQGTDKSIQSQSVFINRNGLKIQILDNITAMISPRDGSFQGLVIIMRDLSDSHRIKQVLQNEQRRLRDAQAMAMVGNWEYDPDAGSYWYSREVFSLCRIDPDSLSVPESMDFIAALFPDWEKGTPLPESLNGAESLVKSIVTIKSAGSEDEIFHLMARLVKNPENGKSLVTGIIQNFSELSQTKEALKKSQEQLRQVARMEAVGKLAGGIAHEFNNLLQIILGYGQLLRDSAISPESLEYVDPILKTAASARNLTRQLLLFSRKENLDMQTMSLSSMLHNLIPILSRLLEENITIESDLDPDTSWIFADKQQIEQVLINLSLNARDAMPNGGKVIVRYKKYHQTKSITNLDGSIPAGDYAHISIQDSGSGIQPEILPEIFDPFFTTKEKSKGTGLGLSIVYGIIQQHKGYVDVKSSLEKGTTFHIYLPTVAKPDESEKGAVDVFQNVKGNDRLVYIAEDDPMVRQLSETMLRNSGFIPKSYIHGQALIDALEKNKPQSEDIALILMDVIMPVLGGVQAFHKMRALGYDTPVLFMSGYTEDRLQNLADLKNARLIRKPFTLKDLMQEIFSMIDDE